MGACCNTTDKDLGTDCEVPGGKMGEHQPADNHTYKGNMKNNMDLFQNEQLEIFEQSNNNQIVLVSIYPTNLIFVYRKLLNNLTNLIGTVNRTSKTEKEEKLDRYACQRTELFIRESGSFRRTRKIEEVFRFGQTEADMTDSGEMVWLTVKEDQCMLKAMSMKESGLTTRPTVMVCILILTVQDTKANGTKTSNMAMELNNGQTVQSTKDNTSKA